MSSRGLRSPKRSRKRVKSDHFLTIVRAACLQNETAPEKLLNRYEKRFEKTRKRIRKTIRNAFEKLLAPLRPLKNISPALFNQILRVFHRPKFVQKKVFFHREALQGWPRQTSVTLFLTIVALSRLCLDFLAPGPRGLANSFGTLSFRFAPEGPTPVAGKHFEQLTGEIFPQKAIFRRVRPPCCQNLCCPVFVQVVGELGAADPSKCARAHAAKC